MPSTASRTWRPGLVTPEKAARGKLPTDVWWHTIVPTSGREKTGYPTQKPEGILRRIVQASSRPGDRVLDLFAGSGTTGAVAAALGRDAVLVDDNPEAIAVMRARIPGAVVVAADRSVVAAVGHVGRDRVVERERQAERAEFERHEVAGRAQAREQSGSSSRR